MVSVDVFSYPFGQARRADMRATTRKSEGTDACVPLGTAADGHRLGFSWDLNGDGRFGARTLSTRSTQTSATGRPRCG